MFASSENATQTIENRLPLVEVSSGVSGSKDGRGIGDLVDRKTIEGWVQEYLVGRSDLAIERPMFVTAFQFGVRAEGRYAGQSFIEAEPEVRSEWSCERD